MDEGRRRRCRDRHQARRDPDPGAPTGTTRCWSRPGRWRTSPTRLPEVVEVARSLPALAVRARRRGAGARRPGPAAAVPGDCVPHGDERGRPPHAVLLRPAPPRRPRPRRLPRLRAPRRSRRARARRSTWSPGWSPPTSPRPRRSPPKVLDLGHEGVVVKNLAAPYDAGRRGSAWVKVKPVHTLDLVVLAVEWGSGRRRGWLSNIHLGARDGDSFVMLGKTFKGMTDEMLAWQTTLHRAGRGSVDGPGAPRRSPSSRAGRRDRLRRPPALHPLPRRPGAPVRPGGPLPRRQDRRRGGHHRHGSGPGQPVTW